MHFTYAYVDMAWDMQSMIYLALMMGLINSLPGLLHQKAQAAVPEGGSRGVAADGRRGSG
jgi:hypothetical protein